ncbi:hypothetical protein PRIPAC_81053 [Pristionchus pacificus]|uniref:Dehydrogenase n=1 Tax=Pristionchus pacificus TaxID=54126 RepID=A0A454XPD9_PRIPA|nr:hypothetical protein PRIPAC_81053 [Pristionchus pacificus]|eukprot:PDM80391.1 dehydrogenase [Pristionchus pacificus]
MVCQCTLNFLGYSVLARIAYCIVVAFYNILFPYFIGTPIDLYKKAGAKWAVVTGATDGIGKAYATQLAKKKFNIYLISRTQSKLDATKKEIEAVAPGIGILVNNVGMSFEYPEVLHATVGGLQRLADMTTINCLPTVLLSAVALKQMSERKAGVVINIASFAGYNEMSQWNVYSASKRFVLHLSGILRAEYAAAGVTVQTIAPLLVATNMSKIRRASFFGPFAETFVAQALRTVGLLELMGLMPRFLRDAILKSTTETMRAAVLKRLAKEQ